VVLRAAVHYADGKVIVTGQPGTTALTADGWVAVGGSGVVWTPPVDVTIVGAGPAGLAAHSRAAPYGGRPGGRTVTRDNPRRKPWVSGPDLITTPSPSWAAAERVRAEDEVACGHVVIGVAQAGRGELDHELALARRVQVELGYLPFAR
jgi:hypothetical protein